MLLAELPAPDQAFAWQFFLTIAAIASIAVNIKKLLPAKRQPPVEAEFVNKQEFADFKKDEYGVFKECVDSKLTGLHSRIGEMQTEILAAGERRGNDLHGRITEIATQVSAINERTKKL